MIDAMKVRSVSPNTQVCYVSAIYALAKRPTLGKHLGRPFSPTSSPTHTRPPARRVAALGR